MGLFAATAHADASHPTLAAYYGLHMVLHQGVVWAWRSRAPAQRQRTPDRRWVQVGVSARHCHALSTEGELWRWSPEGSSAERVMEGMSRVSIGASGWFGIDRGHQLWHATGESAPLPVASGVADAAVGDSADYWVGLDGRLWVRGLAHRGQYGDGLLRAGSPAVHTLSEVLAVRSHTGHALALLRDGTVVGTGGNRYGPLSSHGLGDKADRWGPIFRNAQSIATGSRHSLALARDGSLWAWGDGFSIEPRQLVPQALACAAGDTSTLAWLAGNMLVQWEQGREVSRIALQA